MLLSLVSFLRRADSAAVIGAALVGRAAGLGHRPIATGLAVASSTVRGWLRRFGAQAEPIRAAFTVLARDLAPDPSPIEATSSAFADAASAVTGGRLLAPGGPTMLTNTTRPWAGHR